MKVKFVLGVFVLLTALLLPGYRTVQSEQHDKTRKPAIALVLSKPADSDQINGGADREDAAGREGADVPVEHDAPDDGTVRKAVDEGETAGAEEAEAPVQDSASDHFRRGVAHDKSGMYGKAIESYKRAIMMKPDYQEAYYNLAFSYLLSHDVKSAHEEYMLLKEINPHMAEDLYNKALIMVRSSPENKLVVQVGAFRNMKNADAMVEKLKAHYMHARIEAIDGYSKVRLFGIRDKEEADLIMKEISDKFSITPFLVPAH